MLWATSSFPDPLGPVMSTLAWVGATLPIISFRCCTGSDSPTISLP